MQVRERCHCACLGCTGPGTGWMTAREVATDGRWDERGGQQQQAAQGTSCTITIRDLVTVTVSSRLARQAHPRGRLLGATSPSYIYVILPYPLPSLCSSSAFSLLQPSPSHAPPRRRPCRSAQPLLRPRRSSPPDRKSRRRRRRRRRREHACATEQRLGHRRGGHHRIRDPWSYRHRRLGPHPPAQAAKGTRHCADYARGTAPPEPPRPVTRLLNGLF
ncbi:hypothetical protein DAEQUDRAFT_223280 [Daedalea quercina L-15889]|uniref:Uncharacterized protein n=1 Tax=Daedalea quercina L-15889 TaxID=1314783 RepID=A0A165QYN6_9APHY|nr:hypothetical protein DAEQUDRAFT_223280 [Daedalea quercina L-15889]